MNELKGLTNHRYLLRSKDTQKNFVIIEAKSIFHAEARALRLLALTNIIDKGVEIEVMEADMAMQLPTFLDGYFSFFEEPSSSTQH